LLFTVTSSAFQYLFKLTQPLTFSTVQLLYTVKEKEGKPERKLCPLPYGLGNPYRNLKSENSEDNGQKPQRNCTFMNSASVVCTGYNSQDYAQKRQRNCTFMNSASVVCTMVHCCAKDRTKSLRGNEVHLAHKRLLCCSPMKNCSMNNAAFQTGRIFGLISELKLFLKSLKNHFFATVRFILEITFILRYLHCRLKKPREYFSTI
jgi:hypothetical protein